MRDVSDIATKTVVTIIVCVYKPAVDKESQLR